MITLNEEEAILMLDCIKAAWEGGSVKGPKSAIAIMGLDNKIKMQLQRKELKDTPAEPSELPQKPCPE